jgi:hypothetical protein
MKHRTHNIKTQLVVLYFQIGVNCIGLPELWKHSLVYGIINNKSVKK